MTDSPGVTPDPPAGTTGIVASGLTKRFATEPVVDDVSLDVQPGALMVLLGPSGCGKTTLLRMLSGLEEPSTGCIVMHGRTVFDSAAGIDVAPGRRRIGMVFQSYALWPHMTVRGNVTWPLKVAGLTRTQRQQRCEETLDLLGIDGLADRHPSQLSGGQQQRVAIARTIASRPDVLLFDEPLSNLDAALRNEMRAELGRIHRVTAVQDARPDAAIGDEVVLTLPTEPDHWL